MLLYDTMEQVCDMGFHMKFNLRFYAYWIKSYTYRNNM